MTIEAVKMMRSIRDQMSLDIQGMTFKDEQKYLSDQIVSFKYLTETMPNKAIQLTPKTLRVSVAADG